MIDLEMHVFGSGGILLLPPHPFENSDDFISQIVPVLLVHMATQIFAQIDGQQYTPTATYQPLRIKYNEIVPDCSLQRLSHLLSVKETEQDIHTRGGTQTLASNHLHVSAALKNLYQQQPSAASASGSHGDCNRQSVQH